MIMVIIIGGSVWVAGQRRRGGQRHALEADTATAPADMVPPRSWITTLAALTTLMASNTEPTPPQLGDGDGPPRLDHQPHLLRAHTAKTLVGRMEGLAPSSAALERRTPPSSRTPRFDLVTIAQVALITATVSSLVLGLSCYACHRVRAKSDGRRCRYAKVADGTATPDRRRTLRLSPIGPAARCNRDNWASISLVNLLNKYPAKDVEAAVQPNDRDDDEGSRTSDT
ncbi:uncharacterized protein LOC142769623 [Rhipicephalus microplus]|uniref:uncharacterized protein LOC142769623 n=1 Tax=Rhipicephalus microplus TaxID=6941 RepID=UPI003F6BF0F2